MNFFSFFLPFSRWSKVGNHARFLDMQNIANRGEVILFGGDSHSTFSALLSGTPEAAIFRIFLRPLGKQKS